MLEMATRVLDLFRRKPERRSITSLPWDQGGTLGGGSLSIDSALALVPVYSAVGLLARTVSCTPLHAYRRISQDERRRMPLPPLFSLLQLEGRLKRWIFEAVESMATCGNAIGLVTERSGLGFPTVVMWLNPNDIHVEDGKLAGEGSPTMPIWRWNGRVIQVGPANTPSSDIIHIPWFPVPGRILGLSPLGAAASLILTGINAQGYAAEWFGNGGIPPGTMRNTEKTLNPDEANAIKERLVSTIRARKPLVYGSDWEYKPIAIPPHEAAFVATAKLTATQVAAIYDLPPERIGGETGGPLTYSSPEQTSIHLITFSLRNWYELLEECFAAMLPQPQYVKFSVDSLARADIKTRHEVYKLAREIGLNSIDELRALEDRPPLPDGSGQDFTPLGAPAEPTPDTQPEPSADPTAPPPIPLRRPA